MPQAALVPVCTLDELQSAGRKVVKAGSKQIALFWHAGRVLACNNRCPHEGYPLIEGSLAARNGADCALVCNWHSWAFDLADGSNLTGGDAVRTYPTQLADGQVLVDVSDPPAEVLRAKALAALREAFHDADHDRLARELTRYERAEGDMLDAVRAALLWSQPQFEFGTTHAHAALPDWLALRTAHAATPAERLSAVNEALYNLAWDCLREPAFPFAEGIEAFDADALAAAIEAADEATAVRIARGGLAEGGWAAVEPALACAALAHYADFGHSAIYTYKARQLIAALGEVVAEPLTLLLIRSFNNARREDLIPEFRRYAAALAAWDASGAARPEGNAFFGLDVNRALDLAASAGGDVPALYAALLHANALSWLSFDLPRQEATRQPVSHNVGWLDFTHGVTFANAVRALCTAHPALWPQGLLQMACFSGRNARFLDRTHDFMAEWAVDDGQAFLRGCFRRLFDHGAPEPIVYAHLVKVVTAVAEEVEAAPDAAAAPVLLAALNRFLNSPLKRRHALRTAEQALSFVAAEG